MSRIKPELLEDLNFVPIDNMIGELHKLAATPFLPATESKLALETAAKMMGVMKRMMADQHAAVKTLVEIPIPAAIDKRGFLNRVRSLFNIDGHLLPELTREQQGDFLRDPVRYFIAADAAQSDAIWREVENRQPRLQGNTVGGEGKSPANTSDSGPGQIVPEAGPATPQVDALEMARGDASYDLEKSAEFLLWQYDREGPLMDSKEAWEQMRAALSALRAGEGTRTIECERYSLDAEPQEDGLVRLILYRTTDPGPVLEFKPEHEMLVDYPHAVEALGKLALAVEKVRPKEGNTDGI